MRQRPLGSGLVLTAAALASLVTAAGAASASSRAAHTRPAATSTTTTTTLPFQPLKVGAKGDRVRQVQSRLKAKGYSVVPDGVFGAKTRTAVKRFQASKGLAADGVVGPRTWKALGLDTPPTTTTTTTTPTTTPTPTVPAGAYHHPNPNVERWHAAALAGGWTEDQWPRLSCIIQRESNGIPTAKNPSGAMGLLQIMWSAHASWIGGSSSQLLDGPTNLRIGKQLFDRSGGWGPWRSTYTPC